MTMMLLALACKGDDTDLDTGLYLQVPQEDGSCQVFEGDTLLLCFEQAGDCSPIDGLTLTLSDQPCPAEPSISCEPDDDWPSYYYGEGTSTDAFSFCQSCATEPSPVSLCPQDQDGDGSPETEDCDDTNPAVYPGALEICDGVDNDCNGEQDEAEISFGECIEGVPSCDEARSIQGNDCVLWRDAWLGPYTFAVSCEGGAPETGAGTLVGDAAGPAYMSFESETAPFLLNLTGPDQAEADFGGKFTREASGELTLSEYLCEGTFTPS